MIVFSSACDELHSSQKKLGIKLAVLASVGKA
jgi:hypothetical protein